MNSPITATPKVSENSVTTPSTSRAYLWLSTIILGYIGIYLCRKNFSVAVAPLQKYFSTTKEEIGFVASYSTIAYAAGKFFFGAVVDRIGGRISFLASMCVVAVLGVAGGLAPTLTLLTLFYSANRFVAAGGWPAMMKMVPSWFKPRQLPFAIAVLSLSFVVGGACATMFAGVVAKWSANNWRAIMAAPSALLLLIVIVNQFILPRDTSVPKAAPGVTRKPGFSLAGLMDLLSVRQFWIVCALSFTLTLLRETFNIWLVDFIRTEGGATVSNQVAAFLSTPFDVLGALGILAMGWIYGRISNRTREWLLFVMLIALAGLIYVIPALFAKGLTYVTIAIGLIGFLCYGPYSLLAGTLSVEIRGQERVGTVSGIVDGVGYVAAFFSGAQFGRIVDRAGYAHGFALLAGLAAVSAVLCLVLYRGRPQYGASHA